MCLQCESLDIYSHSPAVAQIASPEMTSKRGGLLENAVNDTHGWVNRLGQIKITVNVKVQLAKVQLERMSSRHLDTRLAVLLLAILLLFVASGVLLLLFIASGVLGLSRELLLTSELLLLSIELLLVVTHRLVQDLVALLEPDGLLVQEPQVGRPQEEVQEPNHLSNKTTESYLYPDLVSGCHERSLSR